MCEGDFIDDLTEDDEAILDDIWEELQGDSEE